MLYNHIDPYSNSNLAMLKKLYCQKHYSSIDTSIQGLNLPYSTIKFFLFFILRENYRIIKRKLCFKEKLMCNAFACKQAYLRKTIIKSISIN